jgi:hypothetical protein
MGMIVAISPAPLKKAGMSNIAQTTPAKGASNRDRREAF